MKTTLCEKCNKTYSLRVFVTHIKKCNKEMLERFVLEFKNSTKICVCGNTFCEYRTINDLIMEFLTGKEKKKIYCSALCYKKHKTVWNKGKTKEDSSILKKISESRTGLNNPIHKVLNDPSKKLQWINKIKEGAKDLYEYRQGKSLEELYGTDKAKQIKQKQSESAIISAKVCKLRGMKGKSHSQETKRKLALKTSEYNSKNRVKVSRIQQNFFNHLLQTLSHDLSLEYLVEYYSIDIAIPGLKIAIEVDGDYWHSNESLGYKANNPLLEKNLKNDSAKDAYLTRIGWHVIRLWENDINTNLDMCVQKIQEVINERMDPREHS